MLPPTQSAAEQHSYQVQQWLGNDLNPTIWGWKLERNRLKPIQTNELLLPENLLKTISCNVTKECLKSWGCVKHGLKCSDLLR